MFWEKEYELNPTNFELLIGGFIFFYKGKNGITEHAQMEQDTDIQIWFSMMEADFFVIFSELLYILV